MSREALDELPCRRFRRLRALAEAEGVEPDLVRGEESRVERDGLIGESERRAVVLRLEKAERIGAHVIEEDRAAEHAPDRARAGGRLPAGLGSRARFRSALCLG